MLLEESLRRDEHAFIDFRDSPVGRQAYILGSRVAVWQVVAIVRCHSDDVAAAATHLGWPEMKVQAALSYGAAHSEEIEDAIRDSEALEDHDLRRLLPHLEDVVVP